MFCPVCHEPNPVGRADCGACETRLPDRARVYVGQQFILLDADDAHPIAVRQDDGPVVTATGPTIVSRHRHAVAFGDAWDIERQPRFGAYMVPIPDQPRLDTPRLDLVAVVTERQIYRPGDQASIFVVAPDRHNQELELEVRLADQQIMREKVTLDAGGLALVPYADLEEGEYTVRARRAVAGPGDISSELGRQEANALQHSEPDEWAECRFSVAEFTLSPLVAVLESHTFDKGILHFQLRVQQLSVPYSGGMTFALQCAACDGRAVQVQELMVQEGRVKGEFGLSHHSGPFKLQLATPQGETALVDLPGSGMAERERIVINPLGQVAEASLLPGDDTLPVRGMHVGPGAVSASPLRLETAIAREACFTAAASLTCVQIVAFNPLSGKNTVHAWQDVVPGDQLTLKVSAPFSWFTVAAVTSAGLYESWATVIRPPDLEAALTVPEKAAPGDQINITVSATPSPALLPTVYCLLLTYDARLEHESPVPKLGKRQYQFIRDASDNLSDGLAPDATQLTPPMLYRTLGLASGVPDMRFAAMALDMTAPGVAGQLKDAVFSPRISPQAEVEAPPLSVPPTRQDFPELAYLELFQFEGQAERVVPLGEQIGTWRCRAYLISGLDVVKLTADVQAEKALYAELDLPAIVADGDEIQASVTYHSTEPAEMTITLPSGETVQGMVMGHGTEWFPLTGPGEVSVQLTSSLGQDWTARTVKPPGVQTVTASRLELLRAGETVSGQRVVVYPGVDLVLTDTIEALLRYPFG